MPRPKTRSDDEVLRAAVDLVRDGGIERLTFAALAEGCGLSAATLVQRFGTKAALRQRALLRAWDDLDARTAELARTVPATPDGAVELLVGLSHQYGDEQEYRAGLLLLLHEDLRDPVLRERGAIWGETLMAALDERFATVPDAPPRIGYALATHWQGALTWWAFRPSRPVAEHVAASLREALATLVPSLRPRSGSP